MPQTLTEGQRTKLLAAIDRVLMLACPEAFAAANLHKPGGVRRIADHLDALVEIVRRSTATQVEPYLWQVLEEVCDHCEIQDDSGHCPLRHRNLCVLHRSVPELVETIAAELVGMKDPEYLRVHPQWRLAKG